MIMERNEGLKRVLAQLAQRNTGRALTELHNFFAAWPRPQAEGEIDALMAEYQTMTHYWRHGYKDPQLMENYELLLHRTYRLYADTSLWRRIGSSPFASTAYSNLILQSREWSVANVRQEMETFVSDVAMVELAPANKQDEHREALYARHYQQMSLLFDYIWTSRQWSDATAEAFEEMLLSPTIDNRDQQLLVSAVTLSLINTFDFVKFRMLVNVYRQSTDELVRQRALVGWVLGRNYTLSRVFPEERQLVNSLLEDEEAQKELAELQIQMIYTVNAESDHQKIQSEIMPDILKNNNFRITRHGIEEVEEDPLEDILHPEADDERMEKVEESFRKMVDMQKQGSDIYFGGFSQMKRFSFFRQISNWFIPFTLHHPEVVETMKRLHSNRFLQQLLATGPFCNSDKYSFVFAFSQVLERVPQNLREMLERGEATMGEVADDEIRTPTYIRRMYLQDLYRFFRLFPSAGQFDHPFQTDGELGHVLFFASPLFKGTPLERHFDKVVTMLLRQKRYQDEERLLRNYSVESQGYMYWMAKATMWSRGKTMMPEQEVLKVVKQCYEEALRLQPDSEKARQGLARTLFACKRYDEAIGLYDKLIEANPTKKNYELNRAVCLTNVGRYEEARNTLYRMNYEAPDDLNVLRVLAWTLTGEGKYEQALPMYERLTSDDNHVADDFLNQGYCLWFAGQDIAGAVKSFRRYLTETEASADQVMENERELLERKGITEPEMQMMLDAISS
jgi:tetratricopeptide (TPR) repeat protein